MTISENNPSTKILGAPQQARNILDHLLHPATETEPAISFQEQVQLDRELTANKLGHYLTLEIPDSNQMISSLEKLAASEQWDFSDKQAFEQSLRVVDAYRNDYATTNNRYTKKAIQSPQENREAAMAQARENSEKNWIPALENLDKIELLVVTLADTLGLSLAPVPRKRGR